jgi:hypothetical protein
VITLRDRDDSNAASDKRWTFGSGAGGSFGAAYPDGEAALNYWEDCPETGKPVPRRKLIKCRSYRRAVRVLRWHLMGYKV